jgi:hypothetical protein
MNFCWYIPILDTNQFTSTQTINITVKPSNTLLGFEWMVPEAFVQNKVIIIMDVAIRNYLYKLDGNSFQESYSLEFVSLGITL